MDDYIERLMQLREDFLSHSCILKEYNKDFYRDNGRYLSVNEGIEVCKKCGYANTIVSLDIPDGDRIDVSFCKFLDSLYL